MANEGSSPSTPTHDHDHDHHQNQLIRVQEFGSQTRKLETSIRALVTKPKVDKSMEDKGTYVLVVEGIDCQSDEPVRFDVYIAKPQGGEGDQAGPELGQFAGSLVDLARNSTAQRSLDLGISYLMKEIGATDCGELVVTLKPRSGEVSVGGVRLEYVSHDD